MKSELKIATVNVLFFSPDMFPCDSSAEENDADVTVLGLTHLCLVLRLFLITGVRLLLRSRFNASAIQHRKLKYHL